MREELPELDLASTTIEHLEKGRSRWWTFAGAKANWLLANVARTPGTSIRIDDFYVEGKGPISVSTIKEALKTVDLHEHYNLVSSKIIDLKFRDAVPEDLADFNHS